MSHKNFNKNDSKDNNMNSKINHNNINTKYINNQISRNNDKNSKSIKSSNLAGSKYNYSSINNKNNNNLNNTKNKNDINNGSSRDFDDINDQNLENLDNIKTYKTIYVQKISEELNNNNFDLNKVRTISTVNNNINNTISKNSQLNDNNTIFNKNSIESNNYLQNSINKSKNNSKLKNKNDSNINGNISKKKINNNNDINNEKENENLDKIILIQRNFRKFLRKIKPNIIKVKATSLQSQKNFKKSKNLKKNNLHGTNSFYNSKFQLNSKKNSYKSNKKVSFKDSSKGIENSFSNLEYSHSSEQNEALGDDVNYNNNEMDIKNNDSDSLKSISINKDYLESIRNNGSSINNSIFFKNSIYSINSIDNNIRKYLNNFNSNKDSYIDKSKANNIYEENNSLINTNSKMANRLSKITSSSLKSVKYKYNKIYYEEYLKFLLKENYISFAVGQLKNMGMYYKYYKLIYILKMLEQRIIKIVHQFVFFIIKGEKNDNKTNIFFNILKIYIKNINIIISENNDIAKSLKDEIEFYSKTYQKYKYVPYIRPNDENKLINCQLFNKDDESNELIKYICSYLNFEKQVNNISPELVKSYIFKNPLINYNIFTITRYIDSLYDNIILFN